VIARLAAAMYRSSRRWSGGLEFRSRRNAVENRVGRNVRPCGKTAFVGGDGETRSETSWGGVGGIRWTKGEKSWGASIKVTLVFASSGRTLEMEVIVVEVRGTKTGPGSISMSSMSSMSSLSLRRELPVQLIDGGVSGPT
jgi:hypothetical protein